MPTTILHGPVIATTVHNVVLRRALIHAPTIRHANRADYHKVEVGVRSGEFTTWVGTWDQSKQRIEPGTPVTALDVGRDGMRLRAGQALVVRVTSYGCPPSLQGCRVNFTLAHVGGRSGAAKPLVSSGALIADPMSRAPIATLERQINTTLAEWEESVDLIDPVALGSVATFQGRIQRDSATQISLQRYVGNWVEVNGEFISLGSAGLLCLSTDGLLSATGGVTGTAPSTSTLYYVYVGSPPGGVAQLRLCETAPTRVNGTYYLGSAEQAARWRFVGWVYVNGSTQFTDSVTAREVISYYNRRPLSLFTCPAYNDNNSQTTYTATSVTWAKVNAGTGSDVSFIANGEDAVQLHVTYRGVSDTAGVAHGPAIGLDGVTTVPVAGECVQVDTERVHISIPYTLPISSAARRTASLLNRQSGGTTTIYADVARNGATADPAETYLSGWIMG